MTFAIGWHTGNGGHQQGLGDYLEVLNEAGIPFFIKSVDSYGVCGEAADLMRDSSIPHTIIYRLTTAGQNDGNDYDVPLYHLTPLEAAIHHFGITEAKLPPELDRELVWLEPINEVDKNRADWLGHFAAEFALIAMSKGYKVTMFGWSSGEPEPQAWQTAGMRRYLSICAANPNKAAVSLHEYSFTQHIQDGYPFLVGRFMKLFELCDEMGIGRPTVHFTEWGWEQGDVPEPTPAMEDIDWAYRLYARYPQNVGVAIWALQGGWGVSEKAQKLIAPVTQYMLDAPVVDPEEPPIDPTPTPSTYKHIRLTAAANIRKDPTTNNPAITPTPVKEGLELIKVGDVTGQSVSGDNRWIKAVAFLSRSYVTNSSNGKVKANRNVNLRVTPTTENNWPIVTVSAGVEFESLGNVKDLYNSGLWVAVALYVWRPLAIDVVPEIRLGSPLRIQLTITSPFGSPRSYPFSPTKKQLHEGLDWHTGGAIPVLAMEAGTVDYIRSIDPGQGYGLTVRIKHSDRYSSWYGHLSQIQATLGQRVTKGQQIALSGRSGGSVHHLHCTVQDIPSGLDGYVIDNCSDFTLLMHPAVNLSPIVPPDPTPIPPGNKIDLLPYFLSSPSMGTLYEVQTEGGGQQRHQTQIEGNVFFHTKDREWEQLRYDATAIYRGIDTSPGGGNYYRLSDVGNSSWSKWAARHMAIGEIFERKPTITFARKSNCTITSVVSAVNYLKLNAVYPAYEFFTGIKLTNVIEVEWRNAPNGAYVEKYWYAVGFGLCGWQSADGRRAAISEIHPPGSRLNNQRESGCFG